MDRIKSPERRAALAAALAAGTTMTGLFGQVAAEAAGEPLPAWAGEYRGHAGTLRLHRDGHFVWQGLHLHAGSDAGRSVQANGRARLLDGILTLTTDPASIRSPDGDSLSAEYVASLPTRLFPVLIGARRLLVDDATVTMAINGANGWGRQSLEVQHALQLVGTSRDTARAEPVPISALVPASHRRRLHTVPLIGKVVAIDDLVRGAGTSGSSAALTIDLGEEQGVFVGMALFLGPPSSRYTVQVGRVEARRSVARLTWFNDGPEIGTRVSTAYAI